MPNQINRAIAKRLYTPDVMQSLNHLTDTVFNKQAIIRIEKQKRIELVLHNVLEIENSDSGFQGSNDEVFAWQGVAIRSDKMMQDANNKIVPATENISVTAIENIDLTSPHDPDIIPPYPVTIHSFNLADQLKTDTFFSVTLFVVEGDNGNLGTSLKEYSEIGVKAIKEGASKIAEEIVGDLGAVIGGAVGGPIGAFIGKVVIGKLISLGIDELVNAIVEGLNDDKMKPFVFNVLLDKQNFVDIYGTAPVISTGIQNFDYRDDGAYYIISSEWKLYREVSTYLFNLSASYKSLNEHKANEFEINVPAGVNWNCSGNGFIAKTWSINRDYEFNIAVDGSDVGDNYEWFIEDQKLVLDGNVRSMAFYKNTEAEKQFTFSQKNILVEYKSISSKNIIVSTKGTDGNYSLKIKLVCLGKEVLNETIEVKGQEFTGDEKYRDYLDCIYKQLKYKSDLSPLPIAVEDFVPKKGSDLFQSFGIEKTVKINNDVLNKPFVDFTIINF